MSVNKKRSNARYKGGALNAPTLMLADTYHDLWECNRGQFAGKPTEKALLNWGILEKSIELIAPLYPNVNFQMPASPFVQGQRGLQPNNLNIPANLLFRTLTNDQRVSVSNIEETISNASEIPEGELVLLSDNDLQGDNGKFDKVVNYLLGDESLIPNDDIYILCDAGFGNMGKLGSTSGRLRGIITPQVIGDSANTSLKPIGNRPNVYYAPYTNVNEREFVSVSNLFTVNNGYVVSYIDGGMNDNNPYNFALKVLNQNEERIIQYSPKSNTGPSAALLGGCFLSKYLEANPNLIPNPQTVTVELNRKLEGVGGNNFRATSNVADIWSVLGNIENIDPYIFIDLKRGGDRDQIKAAMIASQEFNNLIFCTGDLLCAVSAVKNGLPTVLQYPKTSANPARITMWPRGVGLRNNQQNQQNQEQWGGSQFGGTTNTHHNSEFSEEEDLLMAEEGLSGEDMLRDAAGQAAAYIKTLISSQYALINNYSQLQIIIDEFNAVGNKQIINQQMLTPLNSAIRSIYPDIIVEFGQDGSYYQNLSNKFSEDLQNLHNQLNSDVEQNNQGELRVAILTNDFSDACSDILRFLTDKYQGKFSRISNDYELYSAIVTILNPFSEDGSIKSGHPLSEPVTASKLGNKNPYAVGLVALTLINDMISNSGEKQTSVATNILFGTSYTLSSVNPLSEITLVSYAYTLIHFTRAIIMADLENGYLLSNEVYVLTQSGGKKRNKTLKRRKHHIIRKFTTAKHHIRQKFKTAKHRKSHLRRKFKTQRKRK
jgi:hypothetical protein